MKRPAFTLLELLLVVAIMGFMGTVTVNGYRAMRRGMEERGAIQNANQFIRAAYQRAQIDRQPVAVYYWNEMLRQEENDAPAIVVGRAVAVRRAGRFSRVDGKFLYDEFGDLIVDDGVDTADEGTVSSSGSGSGVFVYRMNGDETKPRRSTVYEVPVGKTLSIQIPSRTTTERLEGCYAYEIKSSDFTWNPGDAYGFEFEAIQLPHGYLFDSNIPSTAGSSTAPKSLLFGVGKNSGSGAQGGVEGNSTIQIYSMRPDASGGVSAQRVGTTTNPTQDAND